MRRDLLGLRSFVILLCASAAGIAASAEGGVNLGVTTGAAAALALHTLIGK